MLSLDPHKFLGQDIQPTCKKGLISLDDVSLDVLFTALFVLIILSAFFSSSETGMMSLNRYRLRHLVKKQHKGALRASALLARPDRLIGVILIGNNLANTCATTIGTVLAIKLFGEAVGVAVAPLALTLIFLVFAEVTPKTVAALNPERIAFPASLVLKPLLFVLYPFVLLVNVVSNAIVSLFGMKPNSKTRLTDHLHPEELRTVVDEAGDLIPDQHQGMLLNVLDLEKASVEDIMVPRNEVVGIDLEDSISDILQLIRTTEYTRLPVFEGDINNVIGVLHLRNAARFILGDDSTVTHEALKKHIYSPYFVPESTPLHVQLLNFQKEKRRFGIVVDEYGEVQGIATLVDLLEEIVGDFSTDIAEENEQEITPLDDDWYLLDATASVRDINRSLGWKLPTNGPKTINGIIVEFLENIPDALCGFEIAGYRFEVTQLSDTRIEATKVQESNQY